MEIDLQNLPEKLKEVLGNMPDVFKVIYELSAKIDDKEDSDGQFTFIMPDDVKIPFRSSIDIITSLPNGEIEFELLEKDKTNKHITTLYLSHISKSDTMTGTTAVNYAITIASILGAASINIVDAAHVKCKDTTDTFPLSLYRVLTTESMGWYTNFAKVRGISINMNLPNKYGFQDIIGKLKGIQISELLKYYTDIDKIIRTSGKLYRAIYKINLKKGLLPDKAFIMEADKSLVIIREIIDSLSRSRDEGFVDFLKNPEAPCKDKSILLRSLPGFNPLEHCPEAIFNKDKELIIQHPYLNEFLRLKNILQDTTLKLKGGSRRKTRKRSYSNRVL